MQHTSCRWPKGPGARTPCLPQSLRTKTCARAFNRIIANNSTACPDTATIPVTAGKQPPQIDFTNVNRHNFKDALPAIRSAIQEATFIAIDTEFTGLSADGMSEDVLDDFEDRYKRLSSSANSFIICQFGLATFKWHAAPSLSRGGHWEARSFNAYVFPRPDDGAGGDKRFLSQASSLAYLASQGFDFNKMIYDGIGYLPLTVRDSKMRELAEVADLQRRSIELRTPEEEDFVAASRPVVLAWILGREPELQLRLPPSRRLRHLLRMLVQQEFQLPSLGYDPFTVREVITGPGQTGVGAEGCGRGESGGGTAAAAAAGSSVDLDQGDERDGAGSGSEGEGGEASGGGRMSRAALLEGYLQLQRTDRWQNGSLVSGVQLQLTARQRIEFLMDQMGFSLVIEAIRDARRPVVAHNAAYDLAYTLAQFCGPLPRSWTDYKAMLQSTFPGGLYDTKYLAQQLVHSGVSLGDTALGPLHRTLSDEQWLRSNVPGVVTTAGGGRGMPEVRHALGHTGYEGVTDKAHEAGFDAYMTGVAFTRLLRIVEARKATGWHALGEPGPAAASASGSSDGGGDDTTALLQPLAPYHGRICMTRSDLPYMDVYGTDPNISRPTVLHMKGFTPNTRVAFLMSRFAAMGLNAVHISMQVGPGGAAESALVQLESAEQVSRALHVARKKWTSWTVCSYTEYCKNRRELLHKQRQQDGQGGSEAGTSSSVARPAPVLLKTGGAAPGPSGSSGQQSPAREGSASQQSSIGPAGATSTQQQQQQRKQANGAGGNERNKLQAFTQSIASSIKTERKQVGRSTVFTAPTDTGPGTRDVREATASGSDTTEATTSLGARTNEDASSKSQDAATVPTTTAHDQGSSLTGPSNVPETWPSKDAAPSAPTAAARMAEAQAALLERERLRSLAQAAERLRGQTAVKSVGTGDSGDGLALRRPSRPGRSG